MKLPIISQVVRRIFLFLSLQFLFSIPSSTQTIVKRIEHINSHISVSCTYLADLDNDGNLDLISGHSFDTISWYRNNGDWLFSEASILTTEMDIIRHVSACDIDNDGDMDVLAASRGDNTLALFKNDGLGNFGDMIVITTDATQTRFIEGVDIDNDSDNDIIASYQNAIVWYENIDNVSFGEEQIILNVSSEKMAIADMDNDGDMDICTTALSVNDGLIWLRNNGDKTFTQEEVYFYYAPEYISSVSVFDVKGDGLKDIIVVGSGIKLAENIGGGKFHIFNSISSKLLSYRVVDVCDLNKNNFGDIIVTPSESNMYLSQYNGVDFNHTDLDFNNGYTFVKTRHGDIDNDGDLDIIVGKFNQIYFFENFLPEILSQPQSKLVCVRENLSFNIEVKDERYIKWYEKKNDDNYFQWIEENGETYMGVHTKQLSIYQPDISLQGALYFCRISYDGIRWVNSDIISLTFYEDTIPPSLTTQATELVLTESAFTELYPEMVIDELSDNCYYIDTILSKNFFSCEDIGQNTIKITAIDGSGNQTEQNVTINVIDTIPPSLQPFSYKVELFTDKNSYLIEDNSYFPSLAYDNCSLFSLTNNFTNTETLKGASLPLGNTKVKWTATDYSGNHSYLNIEFSIINENDYMIYPNPCSDEVFVEQKYYGKYNLSILDIQGKVLYREDHVSDIKHKINTIILKKGYYIIIIENGIDSKAYNLVKTK